MPFLDNIAEIQAKDKKVAEVIEQVRNIEETHPHYLKKLKDSLFLMRDPIRKDEDSADKEVLYVKERERAIPFIPIDSSYEFVEQLHHDDAFHLHCSVSKAVLIHQQYSHVKDSETIVQAIANRCGRGDQVKIKNFNSRFAPVNEPFRLPTSPRQHWRVDLRGPVSNGARKPVYI